MGCVSSRERVALRPPPESVAGFPRWRLRRDRDIWRAHRRDRSPWWFCSDLHCRFDLPAPAGTCYVATDPATAVRERLGQRLVSAGVIPIADADAFVVSTLRVPQGRRVADSAHPAAATYGVTRELATAVPYGLPQRWAAALHAQAMPGLRYLARFATTPRPNAIALFHDAGAATWPTDPEPDLGRRAAAAAGVEVVDSPRRSALRMATPPTSSGT